MLSFPQTVFTGASYGLVLWFRHVLPTLLPYMILINVLICTPALHWICRITSTFLCPLLGTSYYGTFAVLTGFLCGYPMGAKTTSDLLNVNKISRSEASYLLSFCNNTSPAFILSYVVAQNMKERNLCIPFFLILTFTPLMLSFIFRLFYRLPESSCSFPQVTPGSFSNPSESISDSFLDRCILNAFEFRHKSRRIYDDVLCPDTTAYFSSSKHYLFASFCIPAWRSAPESDCSFHLRYIQLRRLSSALS